MTEYEIKRLCETIKTLIQENTDLEKENRLLGERCNQLLKDKGDLTDQIANIKANCDLAIEGRDVKIMELKKENAGLEKESNRLFLEGAKRVEELEKENADLRNNGFTVSAMTEQQLKVALKKGEQLEKENAELKEQIEKMKRHCNCKHRDSEGYCEVKRTYLIDLSYDGCDKWELED